MQFSFQTDFPAGFILLSLAILAATLGGVFVGQVVTSPSHRPAISGWIAFLVATVGFAVLAAGVSTPELRSPGVLLPPLFVLSLTLIVLFYRRVYGYLGRWRMWSLVALRLTAVMVVLVLLFRPVLSRLGLPFEKPLLLAVLDTSASMSVSDKTNTPSRLREAVGSLDLALPSVADVFRTRLYTTDSVVQAAQDLPEILTRGAVGEGTNLSAAVNDPVQRHPADDLVGLLLLSDGLHNTGPDPLLAAHELRTPLYTVAVGKVDTQAVGKADLAILAVDAPFETPANNQAGVAVSVQAQQFAGRKVRVRLMEDKTELAGADVLLEKTSEVKKVLLLFTPATTGRKRYVAEVIPDPAETITENNRYPVPMLVTDPKIKVLYIEGTLRPEYKPLRVALSKDKNISLTDFYQTQPGKFQARSDQPIRATDGTAVQPGQSGPAVPVLPTTLEQMKLYDVIILGDVPRAMLSGTQQTAIRDAVKSGKALLMLGGTNTLGPGGYADSPMEEALPVKLGGITLPDGARRQDTTPFVPAVTPEGKIHPVLSANVADVFPPLAAASQPNMTLAPLKGCVVVETLKPGATLLLVNPKRQHHGQPLTVLAVEQFGQGRSAVFTADTTWQWSLNPLTKNTYQKFWGQLVRWLANQEVKQKDLGSGVQIVDNRGFYEPGASVRFAARVRGSDGLPTSSASVKLNLVAPDGTTQTIVLNEDTNETGRFIGSFTPSASGAYRFQVIAQSAGTEGPDASRKLGEDQDSFVVSAPGKEFDKLALNAALLEQMARASNPPGYMIEPAGLPVLLDQARRNHLRTRQSADSGREIKVFDHPWWALGLFVGLLTAEWLLRRKWQLT